MANEIPSVRRLRGIGGVTPFRSVFDRPGVPMYTEEQFAGQPVGRQISPAGYGAPRPTPTVAAQYGLGSAREAAIRQAAMGGAAQRPQVPQRPAGFFDSLPSPMSPAGQALGAAATTGLQLSGWQDRPITLGQGLGAMAQAGMEAYTAAEEKRMELERQAQAAEIAKAQREQDIYLKMLQIQATTGKEVFANEKKLRDEFTKASSDFEDALTGFEKVQTAALTPNPTGPTDIALIFGYMKVLDPRSVVREGEFATAENAGGVAEKIRNAYNKVLAGQRLTPKVRAEFAQAAREQFMPTLIKQEAREQSFIGLAQSYELDPNKVVITKLPKIGSISRPYEVANEEEANKLPAGSYVFIGSRLARIK